MLQLSPLFVLLRRRSKDERVQESVCGYWTQELWARCLEHYRGEQVSSSSLEEPGQATSQGTDLSYACQHDHRSRCWHLSSIALGLACKRQRTSKYRRVAWVDQHWTGCWPGSGPRIWCLASSLATRLASLLGYHEQARLTRWIRRRSPLDFARW